VTENPTPLVESLAAWWEESLSKTVGDAGSISVLYSGGLDSSLVAFGLRTRAQIELVTVAVPGSVDAKNAAEGSRLLQLPWRNVTLQPSDVRRVLSDETGALGRLSSVSRAVQVALALGLEPASNELVVCGQGADELFLGYAHFEGIPPPQVMERRQSDLDRLLHTDWPVSLSIASRKRKRLASPFLGAEFLTRVTGLSADQLRPSGERKALLRQMARYLGLPAVLADRPKKAFQYGSGIARILRQTETDQS
jgi:asparagine synthase (glutamine-hydrolysing)